MKTSTRNRPDSAPPSADGDEIARTATQVRHGIVVHDLSGRWFDNAAGHVYQTDCGEELRAGRGAMLTTYPADCQDCRGWVHG